MKRTSVLALAAIVIIAAVAVPATRAETAAKPAGKAEEKAKPAMSPMEEAWMKAATPGTEHKVLAEMEGKWTLSIKSWQAPGQPPQESQGTATRKMIFGGRYLQEDVQGDAGPMGTFTGMGVTGFDNVSKKWVSVWFDNMGTGMMTMVGEAEPGNKVFHWNGEYNDAMTGKPAKARAVTRTLSADRSVFEMHGPGPDGKEFKMVEITYDRVK